MRKILIACALGLASVAAHGEALYGPLQETDGSCYVYMRTYEFSLLRLDRLERRDSFKEMNQGPTWFTVSTLLVSAANQAHSHVYDSAIPTEIENAAGLLACSRDQGCKWSADPAQGKTLGGVTLPKIDCNR